MPALHVVQMLGIILVYVSFLFLNFLLVGGNPAGVDGDAADLVIPSSQWEDWCQPLPLLSALSIIDFGS